MTGYKPVLAIIPARGGSKGVPRKNLYPLQGRPLIAWTIEAARAAKTIGAVVVSTDDDEIAAVAQQNGAEVIRRPPELATDEAMVIDAVFHVLDTLDEQGRAFDYYVHLEPTAPERTPELIDQCVTAMIDGNFDSVATFSILDPPPGRIWRIEDRRPSVFIPDSNPWRRRQDQEPGYYLNGAVYGVRVDALREDGGPSLMVGDAMAVITPEIGGDIDVLDDFHRLEYILERRKNTSLDDCRWKTHEKA